MGAREPRWSERRGEGGRLPDLDQRGARRRTASGKGGAAWGLVGLGKRARICVLMMARCHWDAAQAFLLSRHVPYLNGLCLVLWRPNKHRETARFHEKQINRPQ